MLFTLQLIKGHRHQKNNDSNPPQPLQIPPLKTFRRFEAATRSCLGSDVAQSIQII
ncbi:unnamed protein product, partial [Mesorhabditis spiculigera]